MIVMFECSETLHIADIEGWNYECEHTTLVTECDIPWLEIALAQRAVMVNITLIDRDQTLSLTLSRRLVKRKSEECRFCFVPFLVGPRVFIQYLTCAVVNSRLASNLNSQLGNLS